MSQRMPDPKPDSPVFDGGTGVAVARPDSVATPVLGAVGAVILGIVVFTTLSHSRSAHAQAQRPPSMQTRPMPQSMSQPTMAPPPTQPAATQPDLPANIVPVPADDGQDDAHLKAPAMVVDLSEAPTAGITASKGTTLAAAAGVAPNGQPTGTADEQFAKRIAGSSVETAHATRLANLSATIPQGAVIAAVLETAIDSDLPGFVRAVVSRDVKSFDGSAVLIPRGSKLIGQYKSAVAVGQTRAFVIWSRVITPDGVSVDIGSPTADELGRGGLAGKTDSHFLQRFGSSILLSVLNAGLSAFANQGVDSSTNTAIVIGSPQQATNVATLALQKDVDIPPTIKVAQGAPVRVFVARDLDFSGVVGRR